MKIRLGFVSNSSCASFSIKIDDLSEEQYNRIVDAIKDKKENVMDIIQLMGYLDVSDDLEKIPCTDHWTIMILDGKIIADTFCNNGCIEKFFKDLSIPEEKIDFWDESDEPWSEEDEN
jgi:hypothetical protein